MKYTSLLAFIICLQTSTFSQITTANFLATAKTKTTVLRQEDKINTLKSTSYKLPFLEKIGFQTETDRFQLQRQQYQTRFSFNGWEEIKQEKQFESGLKVGDKIITKSGFHGKIAELTETTAVIETMSGKLKIERSAISLELTAALNKKA